MACRRGRVPDDYSRPNRPPQPETIRRLVEDDEVFAHLFAALHDRMPVILSREAEAVWVPRDVDAREALAVLVPFQAELMAAAAASRLVNAVRNDGRELTRDTAAA